MKERTKEEIIRVGLLVGIILLIIGMWAGFFSYIGMLVDAPADCFCENEGYKKTTDYNYNYVFNTMDIECDGKIFHDLKPVYTTDKWGRDGDTICYTRDRWEQ